MTNRRPAVTDTLTVFVIAGEESGDALGAELMRALRQRLGDGVRFVGVGGSRMAGAGLRSLFPMETIALHGISAVIARLPRLLALIRSTAAAVVDAKPDVLVLVDVPGFNLRVARRVRREAPAIAVVDYVSPTVWAYSPGRARRMSAFVDEVLAILPFEPRVHRDLGGPPCVYVGHPLIERLDVLRPAPGERTPIADTKRPVLLVLPGSRRSEVRRLMEPFGRTVALIKDRVGPIEVILPGVAHLAEEIRERSADWPTPPRIVEGEEAKFAAFRRAHAALAASGTVTLELALSGVPMVVAYRIEPFLRPFKPLLKAKSIVLANLVLDANVIPEFLDRDSNAERLSAALLPLLAETRERARQVSAFARLDNLMALPDGKPSDNAAGAVLEAARVRRLHAALESSR